MQLTYTPDEPQLFLLREKPEDPQFEPHAGIKMAHGLVSPSSTSVGYTDVTYVYCIPSILSNFELELLSHL